jgi:hypothetical protein
MALRDKRGLVYVFSIGILLPSVYTTLLGYVAAYIQLPLAIYFIKQYSFDAALTIRVIIVVLDFVLAVLIAIFLILPHGLFGHGSILWKTTIFLASFFLGLFFPWDEKVDIHMILFVSVILVLYYFYLLVF